MPASVWCTTSSRRLHSFTSHTRTRQFNPLYMEIGSLTAVRPDRQSRHGRNERCQKTWRVVHRQTAEPLQLTIVIEKSRHVTQNKLPSTTTALHTRMFCCRKDVSLKILLSLILRQCNSNLYRWTINSFHCKWRAREIWVRGDSRSLKIVPFDRSHEFLFVIVTIIISCIVSHIKRRY